MTTLRIIRCHERRFDEMASFIAERNPDGKHHIGYFGVTAEDVRQSIRQTNLRFDRGFRLALWGNRIVGVLGVDFDRELGRAWLYGPIIDHADWGEISDALYTVVRKGFPAGINEQEMFIDARAANARAFAQSHGFSLHGEMAIYSIAPNRLANFPQATANEWDSRFTDQFLQLHERLFPRSNYTLSYLLDEYAKGAVFLILAEGERLTGYFFGRAEPESGEAYVDLVGIAENYRRNGLGRRLMLAGLARLQEMPGLRQVNLTVAGGNEPAIRLYDSLGFRKERDMVAYRKFEAGD